MVDNDISAWKRYHAHTGPVMKQAARTSVSLIALSWATACSELPTEQVNTSLVGLWKLVAYQEDNRIANPSGNWVFFEDGFMALDLQLEFSDGPTGYIAATGDFQQIPDGVVLRVRGSETVWSVEFTTTEATLRKTAPLPADDRFTLQRY